MPSNINFLKKVPLFSQLDLRQLKEIENVVIERTYPKGHIIFIEGETGEAIFFLKKGCIKISKQSEDGREHILHYIHPGEVFAEVVLFDNEGYPATAEATEDAEVGLIRNRDVDKIILKSPQLALALLKIMARRLRHAQQQINDLALMDASCRLAATLLKLAEQHGERGPDRSTAINFQLTNQELASLIGTSRETANRILNNLKRQNIINIDKQQIYILNKNKLARLCR
ncbi:MAG TPA: Crp/Fnr family transcriptional regulator [Clostridia bacterium]|nr:Crp/Fnr family transcriptional regulator [Clostridia bacterium]